MEIKAVIFDIGGVLVRTEDHRPRQDLAHRFGMQAAALENLVFNGDAGHAAQRGEVTAAAHWTGIAGKLGVPPAEIQSFRDDFFAGDVLDEQLLAFARGLRPALRTGIITNAFDDVRNSLHKDFGFSLESDFDHVVVSAEEGLMKPDPRIYQKALSLCKVEPGEALFVDDFLRNVEGARSSGMHAVHFRDREKAIREIQTYL